MSVDVQGVNSSVVVISCGNMDPPSYWKRLVCSYSIGECVIWVFGDPVEKLAVAGNPYMDSPWARSPVVK